MVAPLVKLIGAGADVLEVTSWLPRRVVWFWFALTAGAALLVAVSAVVVGDRGAFSRVVTQDVASAAILSCAGLCWARGVAGGAERIVWRLAGAALTLSFASSAYIAAASHGASGVPVPSPADVLGFAAYGCAGTALFRFLRGRVPDFHLTVLVDAVIAALSLGAVSATFVFPDVLAAARGDALRAAVLMSYPAFDLVIVTAIIAAIAVDGGRGDRIKQLVLGGFVLYAVADSASAAVTRPGALAPAFVVALGTVASLLFAAAAWHPAQLEASRRLAGWHLVAVPTTLGAVATAVLVVATRQHVNTAAVALAAASLVALLVRMSLTFGEHLRLVEFNRTEALTDSLTTLGNRRRLLRDLEAVLSDPARRSAATLLLYDLNGFKRYNDSFGHPAGDALLARLGGRLAAATTGVGSAYRMGGDEFCALLHRPDTDQTVLRTTAALGEIGDGFAITTAFGSLRLDVPGLDAGEALRLVDQRMYAQKRGVRSSSSRQTGDALLRVLLERNPDLGMRVSGVADLAVTVAAALGLEGSALEEVRLAGDLHDIGKIAIPDAILHKPGALDADEWQFIRRHTIIGERIIASAPDLAPVGCLVRASHERFDGGGYPDGLAGAAIPLGARIVAVCDAYEAMIADRPYRKRRTASAALAELEACSATQFDPEVVEAVAVVIRRQQAPLAMLEPRVA